RLASRLARLAGAPPGPSPVAPGARLPHGAGRGGAGRRDGAGDGVVPHRGGCDAGQGDDSLAGPGARRSRVLPHGGGPLASGMARETSSTEHVTRTGIRIVGKAAAELVAQAAAIALTPPPVTDALWAARFRVRARLGGGSPVPALLETIGAALRSDWDGCPAITRDTPFTRPAARFRGISWDVIGDPGAWRGELVWRHQHHRLAGTAVTTHLVIDEQQQFTTLTLVAAADGGVQGVRGIVGAGQSRPPILDALRQAVVLSADGDEGRVHPLDDADVAPFVREVLLSDDRAWPVAVLAPLEHGGYLLPPEQLADELFGLAPVHAI